MIHFDMPEVRRIISSQQVIHEHLDATVRKHQRSSWQKPIAEHTQRAFDTTQSWLAGKSGDLILDSCCGYGESTRWLAHNFPESIVLGLDKSAARLAKNNKVELTDNCLLVRADVNDFWRLAASSGWKPKRHYMLYPNPYPKTSQLNSRWHGSPAFPTLIQLGGLLEVRTNWHIYILELQRALNIYNRPSTVKQYTPDPEITAFERKYHNDGQPLWQLTCKHL